MNYFYSYSVFYQIFFSTLATVTITVLGTLLYAYQPKLSIAWILSVDFLLITWSLHAVCPYAVLRPLLLKSCQLSLIPAICSSMLFFYNILHKNQLLLYWHQIRIIDSLWNNVIILNSDGTVLYCSTANKYHKNFVTGTKPDIPSDHALFPLLGQRNPQKPSEGVIKDEAITWHYQLRLLQGGKKVVLYFIDISSEYSLTAKLQETRLHLGQKEKLLRLLDKIDTKKEKTRLQEHLNMQIDKEVRLKLKHCLPLFDVSSNIDEIIVILETSLSEIRHLVSELSDGGTT